MEPDEKKREGQRNPFRAEGRKKKLGVEGDFCIIFLLAVHPTSSGGRVTLQKVFLLSLLCSKFHARKCVESILHSFSASPLPHPSLLVCDAAAVADCLKDALKTPLSPSSLKGSGIY